MNVLPYLRAPYKIDGYDFNGFYCWGLVWHIYKNELDFELPEYLGLDEKLFSEYLTDAVENKKSSQVDYRECEEHLSIVTMGVNGKVTHCGILIKVNSQLRVIHATSGRFLNKEAGVIITPMRDIKKLFNYIRTWKPLNLTC